MTQSSYFVWLRRLNTINRQLKTRKPLAIMAAIKYGPVSVLSSEGATIDDVLSTMVLFGFMFIPVGLIIRVV